MVSALGHPLKRPAEGTYLKPEKKTILWTTLAIPWQVEYVFGTHATQVFKFSDVLWTFVIANVCVGATGLCLLSDFVKVTDKGHFLRLKSLFPNLFRFLGFWQ